MLFDDICRCVHTSWRLFVRKQSGSRTNGCRLTTIQGRRSLNEHEFRSSLVLSKSYDMLFVIDNLHKSWSKFLVNVYLFPLSLPLYPSPPPPLPPLYPSPPLPPLYPFPLPPLCVLCVCVGRTSDAYCFELLSMVLALSGSVVGRHYLPLSLPSLPCIPSLSLPSVYCVCVLAGRLTPTVLSSSPWCWPSVARWWGATTSPSPSPPSPVSLPSPSPLCIVCVCWQDVWRLLFWAPLHGAGPQWLGGGAPLPPPLPPLPPLYPFPLPPLCVLCVCVGRTSDAYCFELLSMVLALSGSVVGRHYLPLPLPSLPCIPSLSLPSVYCVCVLAGRLTPTVLSSSPWCWPSVARWWGATTSPVSTACYTTCSPCCTRAPLASRDRYAPRPTVPRVPVSCPHVPISPHPTNHPRPAPPVLPVSLCPYPTNHHLFTSCHSPCFPATLSD